MEPPTFASEVSSYLGGISSYISHNLPDKLHWSGGGSGDAAATAGTDDSGGGGDFDHQPPATEKILSATFRWINWCSSTTASPSSSSSSKKRLCLFLGYHTGFHIWDVTDADNVYELASLRTGFGRVHAIEPAPAPAPAPCDDDDDDVDAFKALRPLVALITDDDERRRRSLKLFSMHSLSTAYTLKQQQGNVGESEEPVCVKCNSRVIAVAFTSHVLNIYSSTSMSLLGTFTNAISHGGGGGGGGGGPGVFDIGMRYIIYATSIAPPLTRRRASMGAELDSDEYDDHRRMGGGGRGSGGGGGGVTLAGPGSAVGGGCDTRGNGGGNGVAGNAEEQHIDARKVAGKVAKELVVGAKVLGEFGYHTLSNYFAPASASEDPAAAAGRPAGAGGGGGGNTKPRTTAHHHHHTQDPPIAGAVIIAALPLLGDKQSATTTSPASAVAHWKPHTNPVSVAIFDPSQTLALTASTQGNTFYLWQVPSRSKKNNPTTNHHHHHHPQPRTTLRCLYKLERGYTAATVESIAFSHDSRWIGATTAKGTTHVYRVDPFVVAGGRRNNRLGAAAGAGGAAAAGAVERLSLINGLTEPSRGGGGVGVGDAAFASAVGGGCDGGPGGGGGGGVRSVYPVARVKRQMPSGGGGFGRRTTTRGDAAGVVVVDDDAQGGEHGRSGVVLAAAFLPAEKREDVFSPVARGGGTRRRASGGGDRSSPAGSFVAGSSSASSSRSLGCGSPRSGSSTHFLDPGSATTTTTTRVHRQRVLTFQSSERGGLMIHHVDVILEQHHHVVGSTATTTTAAASTTSTLLSTSAPRSASPLLDRFSPSSLLWSAVPSALSSALGGAAAVGGPKRNQENLRVKVSDVMEWNVKRDGEWGEVKQSFAERNGRNRAKSNRTSKPCPPSTTKPTGRKPALPSSTSSTTTTPAAPAATTTQWMSQIEIRTHYPPQLRPPVWLGPQFVFQVYTTTPAQQPRPSTSTTTTSRRRPTPTTLADLPATTDVHIKREALKPHSGGGDDERTAKPSSHFPTLRVDDDDDDGAGAGAGGGGGGGMGARGGGNGIRENLLTAMGSPIVLGSESGARVVEMRPVKKVPESVSFEDAFHIPIDTPPGSWRDGGGGGAGSDNNLHNDWNCADDDDDDDNERVAGAASATSNTKRRGRRKNNDGGDGNGNGNGNHHPPPPPPALPAMKDDAEDSRNSNASKKSALGLPPPPRALLLSPPSPSSLSSTSTASSLSV
ncbi:hypothetical protein HDU86_005348 [Geranomyces michiganensis]|nr:hypothetical protein HDU86_005348 [Geranomyces michiganensis]